MYFNPTDLIVYIIYASQASFILIIVLCLVIMWTTSPFPKNTRAPEEKYFLDSEGNEIEFPSLENPWSLHLSVVVPAYEEEIRIPKMLDECLEYLESRSDLHYEIIVVSDGSQDATAKVARKYSMKYGTEKLRVLELLKNRGKGGAVCMGVQNARGALILFADADGATKFSDLVKLESSMKTLVGGNFIESPNRYAEFQAIVCGSRAHLEEQSVANRSYFRTILMHGFHFLVWLFTVRNVKDTQCGFKLLTREAARTCFGNLHVERWAFDVELLYIAQKLNIQVSEVAVNWIEIEGSKIIPFWSWLQMGGDLFLIWLRYKLGAWKLQSNKYA